MELDHQCSTKMLIQRFESMSSADTNLSQLQAFSVGSPVRSARPICTPAPVTHPFNPGKEKGKDKSPIRQSIRNLLSVFTGKRRVSGGSPKRHSLEPEPTRAEKTLPIAPLQTINAEYQVADPNTADGEADLARPLISRGITGKLPRVTLVDAPVPPIPLDAALLESPPRKPRAAAKICGVLLYLSYHRDGPSSSSAWLPCKATLEVDERAIFLSWTSSENGQCLETTETHIVALARCTDVRSLVTNQLDEQDTRIPLAGCRSGLRIEEFKVFEVLFEGKEREKFAARTVRERARWVSAIWDAVLPSQEPESSPNVKQPKLQPDPGSRTEACIFTSTPASTLPRQRDIQRPLPVTPTKAAVLTHTAESCQGPPLESSGRPSPTSSSIYPPTRPSSTVSESTQVKTGTAERCHSPSVANLNRMSCVKQRLAQIKDMELQRKDSTSSLTSRASSKDERLTKRQPGVNGGNLQAAAVPPVEAVTGQVDHETKESCFSRNEPMNTVSSESEVPTEKNEAQKGALEMSGEGLPGQSCEARSQTQLDLDPLLDFLHDHTQEQREQVVHLGNQIVCLQDEIQRLPQEFSCIVGTSRQDKASPDIQKLVTKVERKVEATTDVLGAIDEKLTTFSDDLQAQLGTARDKNAVETLRSIDEIRAQLRSHFPAVMARLAQIQETQERNETANEKRPLADRNKQLPPVTDLSAVLAKLDAVIALQRKAATTVGKATGKVIAAKATDVASKDIKAELLNISSILEHNNQQRALHTQQQADSVRYLTELNTWLETFVNHGTSQMEAVAANVEQLCRALGCSDHLGSSVDISGRQDLLTGTRGLVSNIQEREQGFLELQKSVNALLEAMKTPDGSYADLGFLANAIERSRQEQTNLFKIMTKEISSEVKGERIRFVEAMKEATTINIQTQVDSLKQGLAAEVAKMSNEIGRLHQEKQAIEAQVQGLVAFQDQQRLSNQMPLRHYRSHTEGYPAMMHNAQMSFPGR